MGSPYRFRTAGQDNWQAGRTGYRHQSAQYARLKPAGEPSLLTGTLILSSLFIAAVLGIVAFGG